MKAIFNYETNTHTHTHTQIYIKTGFFQNGIERYYCHHWQRSTQNLGGNEKGATQFGYVKTFKLAE